MTIYFHKIPWRIEPLLGRDLEKTTSRAVAMSLADKQTPV
jgi:hypothetical protein